MQVSHLECWNPAQDQELHGFLSNAGEMLSPYITFDFLSKSFEPWSASEMR